MQNLIIDLVKRGGIITIAPNELQEGTIHLDLRIDGIRRYAPVKLETLDSFSNALEVAIQSLSQSIEREKNRARFRSNGRH